MSLVIHWSLLIVLICMAVSSVLHKPLFLFSHIPKDCDPANTVFPTCIAPKPKAVGCPHRSTAVFLFISIAVASVARQHRIGNSHLTLSKRFSAPHLKYAGMCQHRVDGISRIVASCMLVMSKSRERRCSMSYDQNNSNQRSPRRSVHLTNCLKRAWMTLILCWMNRSPNSTWKMSLRQTPMIQTH